MGPASLTRKKPDIKLQFMRISGIFPAAGLLLPLLVFAQTPGSTPGSTSGSTPAPAAAQAPAAGNSGPQAAAVPPDPNSFAGRRLAADELLKAGKADEAIAGYRALLDKVDQKTEGDLWARLGFAYREKGSLIDSVHAFEKASLLLEANPIIETQLALSYQAVNDLQHASDSYARALRMNPNNPLALNNLAFLMLEHGGDLDIALKFAQQAVKLSPEQADFVDTAAMIQLKKNETEAAADELSKISAALPQNAIFHFHYALALAAKGDAAGAQKECDAALANHPDPATEKDVRAFQGKLAAN